MLYIHPGPELAIEFLKIKLLMCTDNAHFLIYHFVLICDISDIPIMSLVEQFCSITGTIWFLMTTVETRTSGSLRYFGTLEPGSLKEDIFLFLNILET